MLLKIYEEVNAAKKCAWTDFVKMLQARSREHSAILSKIVVPISVLLDVLREVTSNTSHLPS